MEITSNLTQQQQTKSESSVAKTRTIISHQITDSGFNMTSNNFYQLIYYVKLFVANLNAPRTTEWPKHVCNINNNNNILVFTGGATPT